MNAIEVNHLTKSYGSVTAIDRLNFSVPEGELFGFIGPDGAGKTTLFRILTTLLIPDSGEAKVNGMDVVQHYKQLRRQIGYMPGRFSLYQDLSVEENLSFFATIFGTTIQENYELIKEIYSQIEPFRKRRAGQLSGGMKQKLALSCALIHKPKILFLDEPTTGVDAVSRKEFWEMLKRLQARNITIIVSTPYMDEAVLCDRVALIQNGHILEIDTPAAIEKQFSRPLFAVKADNRYRLMNALRKFPHVNSVYPFGEFLHYTDVRPVFSAAEIEAYLKNEGLQNIAIHPIPPQIEDSFMELMKKHDDE
jgi:ABC-2 type transport system ATP-binding protein